MGPDPAASVVRPAAGEPALHRASLRAPFKGGGKLERCWSRPGASAHGPASTTQRKQAGPLAWPRAGGQGMLSVQRHKTRRRAPPSQRHISTSLSVQSPAGVRLLWVPPATCACDKGGSLAGQTLLVSTSRLIQPRCPLGGGLHLAIGRASLLKPMPLGTLPAFRGVRGWPFPPPSRPLFPAVDPTLAAAAAGRPGFARAATWRT